MKGKGKIMVNINGKKSWEILDKISISIKVSTNKKPKITVKDKEGYQYLQRKFTLGNAQKLKEKKENKKKSFVPKCLLEAAAPHKSMKLTHFLNIEPTE